jgi:hypothetical protein
VEETNENRDWEAEARDQGWKPLGEFKGPESKWTDPRTFVEKGEKITGIMKSRLDRQEQEIARLRNSNKEFGEYQKQLREKEKQALESRISELEAARAAAITEGDGTAFTRLDRTDPTEVQWAQDNPWYQRDPQLTAFADGVSYQVEMEGYTGPARLAEIARRTRETFPDKFENPNRSGANGVDEGGELETEDSEARTYENLPPDAKAACDRFVADGLTTKEDYVETFEW